MLVSSSFRVLPLLNFSIAFFVFCSAFAVFRQQAFAQIPKAVTCQLSAQLKQRGEANRVIDSASLSAGIGQRTAFSLKDGAGGLQRVQVQPQQFANGRVKATIDWQDARGRSVVSTQMGMSNGENVALMAEGVAGGAVVLHLRVFCR